MTVHTPLTEADYSFIWNSMDWISERVEELALVARALEDLNIQPAANKIKDAIAGVQHDALEVQRALCDAYEAANIPDVAAQQTEGRG